MYLAVFEGKVGRSTLLEVLGPSQFFVDSVDLVLDVIESFHEFVISIIRFCK